MFRDDYQTNRAIATLLDHTTMRSLHRLWTVDGPSEYAAELLHALPPSSERVLLEAAFAIWSGCGPEVYADTERKLSVAEDRQALTGLFFAMMDGSPAVDVWIASLGGPLKGPR